jgi:hypothetical protein
MSGILQLVEMYNVETHTGSVCTMFVCAQLLHCYGLFVLVLP